MAQDIEITIEERAALAGHVAREIYNFFRNQQDVHTVPGNRLAAEKAKLVAGRAVAAVVHPGKVDGEYLMLSRRLEVEIGADIYEAMESVIKDGIKAVD